MDRVLSEPFRPLSITGALDRKPKFTPLNITKPVPQKAFDFGGLSNPFDFLPPKQRDMAAVTSSGQQMGVETPPFWQFPSVTRHQFLMLLATAGAAAAYAYLKSQAPAFPQASVTIPQSPFIDTPPQNPVNPATENPHADELKNPPAVVAPQELPKPLQPEIAMPPVNFKYKLNDPPETIKPEIIGDPPDLGIAYQLALWGDPKWQRIFLEAYKGDSIQTSVQLNNNDGKLVPFSASWVDKNYLSPRWQPNSSWIINKNSRTGVTTAEEIKYEKNIKLPNGEQITGVQIYNHEVEKDNIGILENVWFTTIPENIPQFFGIGSPSANLNGEILSQVVGNIYLIIDDKVIVYNPKELFNGKNPLAKYEYGGFDFSPMLAYKKAQIYLCPNPNRDPNKRPDEIWWKAIGHEFDSSIKDTVSPTNAQIEARETFLEKNKLLEDTVPAENFSQHERTLVESLWSQTIKDDGYSLLQFRVPTKEDLNNIRINITYPELNIPSINLTLQELCGVNRNDRIFANRFISIFPDSNNGGIKVVFNKSFPLPKGSQISVTTNNDAKTECTWHHRPETIGDLRLGIVHQTLDRKKSVEGKQVFDTMQRDFIATQTMLYVDDASFDIQEYNKYLEANNFKVNQIHFLWGPNEGNTYIIEPGGALRPILSGLEDVKGGFYGWIIKPEQPVGNTHKMFYFGRGSYDYIKENETKLKALGYQNKNEFFSLAYTDSAYLLQKGAKLMVMPGFLPFETARVTATLFGYYKVG